MGENIIQEEVSNLSRWNIDGKNKRKIEKERNILHIWALVHVMAP